LVGDGVSEELSHMKVGKDTASRIASRLQEEQREWRERSLEEKETPASTSTPYT
jgi:transposase-like protein